ncbi:MAG TPA: alpha/beta fold hydrolase [Caulobacter sp.]|nr:alpha/beta fold hydrolase [Caulobacter sp.]
MASPAIEPEISETLLEIGASLAAGDPKPLFHEDSLAAALVDRKGRILAASAAFTALQPGLVLDPALLARVADRPGEAIFERVDSGLPEMTLCAYAQASLTGGWSLPRSVRTAAAEAPGQIVVLASPSHQFQRPLETACEAFGLTGLQTRVALETIRTGGVKTAAEKLEISYHTAREALADAMSRVRAPRLPALVRRLVSLAFGVLPDADEADILGDAWGLSPRQAAIAALIADGMTRAEAATALGLSEAVVKRELNEVYGVLQVGSAATLARKVVEANALNWMMRSTGGDIGVIEAGAEPLRLIHRPGGGRIAVSDYGPASGRPVLVVHSSMTSRVVARGLRRALQAAGFRPISIDRPGFGLTDEIEGLRPGLHDPYVAAVDDALIVLDTLKLNTIDIVARGGAQFVVALHDVAPSRLKRVVLVNPDPPTEASDRRIGPFGVLKEAFRRNPAIIRVWAGLVGRQLTYTRVSRMLERSMQGSPPDEAAARDPEIVQDYFRAVRTFATGRYAGYINEQVDFARRGRGQPQIDGTFNWLVMVGAQDTLHDPQEVIAYWRAILVDAQFQRVEDGGRLLALSQPHSVVEGLLNGAPG